MRQLSQPLLGVWSHVTGLGTEGHTAEPPSALCRGVLELWKRFTRERSGLRSSYLDEARGRQAYLAYYFPVNVAKVQALLDEMPEPETAGAHEDGSFHVLDVGSGPGTGAIAVLDWSRSCPALSGTRLEVTAVDASQQALREALRLWEAYRMVAHVGRATLTTIQTDVQRRRFRADSRFGKRSYDLIVVANVLNELFRDRADSITLRAALLRRLLDLLDQHGTLMIIEPALRETSRDLHLVRNAVLAEGSCNVYSPCLHEQACPALVKKDDWCHEERPWSAPEIVGAIDRQVGFIKDSLKFSYLLLRKDGSHIVRREPGVYRVVSELRRMKGEQRAWLCHEQGRPEVGRLDRERSAVNAPFDEWHRGDIVRVGDVVQGNKSESGRSLTRFRKATAVELVRPICPTTNDE